MPGDILARFRQSSRALISMEAGLCDFDCFNALALGDSPKLHSFVLALSIFQSGQRHGASLPKLYHNFGP